MKTLNKTGLILLALLLALSVAAFAEETADTLTEATPAAVTTESAQAAADVLAEALTAYQNAKADSRKEAVLNSLKQELNGYVTAGKLTQEQADLILKHYTEQMTLQQNGSGRGGRGMQNRKNGQNGKNTQGTQQNVPGKGGRHGRFGTAPATPGTAAPEAAAPAEPEGTTGI